MKLSCFSFKLLFLIFTFTVFLFFAPLSLALDMESTDYKIQYGNVVIGGKDQSSSGYNLSTSIGQVAANEFSSSGYIVKAGFQYLHSIIPFTFSISDINIDLGSLVPNTPSTDTTTLTVSAGGAGGYQVTAIEDNPLQTLAVGNTIPNTSCDSGTPCSIGTADVWTSNDDYGFGYNMAGQDVPVDFTDSTYYRPFADNSASPPDSPVVVMSSSKVTMPTGTPTPAPASERTHESTVTFKVNVSPLQDEGTYQTVIKFTATPIY